MGIAYAKINHLRDLNYYGTCDGSAYVREQVAWMVRYEAMQPRKRTPATPAPVVLIVEGQTLVRALVAAYLRDCGYQVIESSTSAEATEVLRARRGIDIVFIDVDTTLDGDGFGLARRVRSEWPEVEVLLSSGVRRTAREAATLCEEGPTSTKPYDHAELARRIRRLVGG